MVGGELASCIHSCKLDRSLQVLVRSHLWCDVGFGQNKSESPSPSPFYFCLNFNFPSFPPSLSLPHTHKHVHTRTSCHTNTITSNFSQDTKRALDLLQLQPISDDEQQFRYLRTDTVGIIEGKTDAEQVRGRIVFLEMSGALADSIDDCVAFSHSWVQRNGARELNNNV